MAGRQEEYAAVVSPSSELGIPLLCEEGVAGAKAGDRWPLGDELDLAGVGHSRFDGIDQDAAPSWIAVMPTRNASGS